MYSLLKRHRMDDEDIDGFLWLAVCAAAHRYDPDRISLRRREKASPQTFVVMICRSKIFELAKSLSAQMRGGGRVMQTVAGINAEMWVKRATRTQYQFYKDYHFFTVADRAVGVHNRDMPDGRVEDAEKAHAEMVAFAHAILDQCRIRDRDVLGRAFGIGRARQSARQMSEEVGRTHQAISQRLKRALARIRRRQPEYQDRIQQGARP